MYARITSILLGIATIDILIEWRQPRDRKSPEPDKPFVLSNDAELGRMIDNVDFDKTPAFEALRTLSRVTRTNIVTATDASNDSRWQQLPVSIHFRNVSLATALSVICDLVSDPTGLSPNTEVVSYGMNDAGVIVVGKTYTDVYRLSLPAQMSVSDVSDLLAVELGALPGQQPPWPMWLFQKEEPPPLFTFLSAVAGPINGLFFGNQLVLHEPVQQTREIRRFIDRIRHPIDLTKPFDLPAYPVRRLARFHLENVFADDAFERWKIAAGANAGYEIPPFHEHETSEYHFYARVTINLTDISIEDAVAPIIDAFSRGMSVYHNNGVVYVRPDAGRPPGQWYVFDISESLAHPQRWDKNYDGSPNLDILRSAANNEDTGRTAIWYNRLAVFGTSDAIARVAENLKALMSQNEPPRENN